MTTPDPPPEDRQGGTAAEAGLERAVRAVRAGHEGDRAAVDAARRDPDPRVRVAAVGAVVRLAGTGALDVGEATADVVAAITDGYVQVRRRAAVETARLATSSEVRPEAVGTIVRALVERLADDDRVAEVAAFALGELPYDGADQARDVAVATLADAATTHEEHLCREAAVAALGSIGDARGLPAVLAAADDRATVRRRAVLALAAFDDPAATEALQRFTEDRDLQVRQAAEELLAIESGEDT